MAPMEVSTIFLLVVTAPLVIFSLPLMLALTPALLLPFVCILDQGLVKIRIVAAVQAGHHRAEYGLFQRVLRVLEPLGGRALPGLARGCEKSLTCVGALLNWNWSHCCVASDAWSGAADV